MEMQYFKDYSPALGRDMECKIYGHAGRPMLYIPCQDGRFFDFEDFHMADTLAPWIDAGKIMVISIDTMDKETWSDTQGDPYWRIRRYEQWLRYIVDEAVPKIQYMAKSATAGTACPASSPSGAVWVPPTPSTCICAARTCSAAAWPSAAFIPPTTVSAITWTSWCT